MKLMSKNNHAIKKNKNFVNIKNVSQKKNNTLILSDYYKSPKNNSILNTISSISSIPHLKNNIKTKNPKIPALKLNQKLKNNYIQPSTIAKYKKSLYYYCKITSTRKYINRPYNIDYNYNNLNPIQTTINYIDNEYIRNNTRIESTCETVNNSNNKNNHRRNKNISMSKIINPKKQVKLKSNRNHHHSCDLFNSKLNGKSAIINLKIIMIQKMFKRYLVRKKVNKKLKTYKQYNKGFNKLNSLLFIFKKNIFLILKDNYINGKLNEKKTFKYNNEICDEISISINIIKNEENNSKENNINNIINNEKVIESNNKNNEVNQNCNTNVIIQDNNDDKKVDDKNINNIAKNYIEDSTNIDFNKVEVNNNDIEKNSKFDELSNNYQNVINEKKELEEKLNKTNDDYNKLKEKIKEYEENNTKFNDILIDNQKIKQKGEEIINQNEKLLKEIQTIKNYFNKFLQEQQKNNINKNSEENDNLISLRKSKKVKFQLENDNNDTNDINQINEVKDPFHKSVSANIFPKRRSLLKNKGESLLKNSLRGSKLEKVNEELHFNDSDSNNSLNSNNSIDEELGRKQKEEKLIKLKNLFKKKESKIKEYLKVYFSSFYYNGIYYKMVGKYPRRGRSRSVIYNSIPSNMVLINALNKIKINNDYNNNKMEDKKEDSISPNISKEENQNINNKENTNINETKKEDSKTNENNDANNIKNEDNKNESNNNNNNENNKSESNDVKNQLKENLDSRIQKARGLRKLLSRKGNEKKEKLRKYFYRFYKAGIFSKVRSVRKVTKKYLERKNSAMNLQRKNNLESSLDDFKNNNNEKSNININNDLDDESTKNKKKNINNDKNIVTTEFKEEEDEDLNNFLKRSKTAIIKFDQKQKELEEKKTKKLQILFYKVDRINMKIIRNVFQKYYLRSKLESISIIEGGTKKKKFKKKKSKKYKKGKSSEKNGDKKDDDKIEDKKEENQEDHKNE